MPGLLTEKQFDRYFDGLFDNLDMQSIFDANYYRTVRRALTFPDWKEHFAGLISIKRWKEIPRLHRITGNVFKTLLSEPVISKLSEDAIRVIKSFQSTFGDIREYRTVRFFSPEKNEMIEFDCDVERCRIKERNRSRRNRAKKRQLERRKKELESM